METTQEPQTIEELTERFRLLSTQRQQAETDLRVAETRLEDARKAARETYGTDDIEALRTKLGQWRAENLQRRAEYQASLDEIDRQLAVIKASNQPSE